MKISIFPEANPHPKGKEEKVREAFKFSAPNKPHIVDVFTEDSLIEYVTNYAWSPFTFKEFRRESDFISTDMLVYDIDEGMNIEECEAIIKRENLCCLCLPSPSHTEEAHRFRIILPLAQTISNLQVYRDTWVKGAEVFGVADEQCKDACRGYFGSTMNDGFWIEGDFFEPVQPKLELSQNVEYGQTSMINVTDDLGAVVQQIYGEKRDRIPEAVDFFLKNAHTGLDGKWTNSLNSFVFSLTLSGVDEESIWDICEQVAPSPLDNSDVYQIKRAIRDGKAAI